MLNQILLKKLLNYDENTGIFTRRISLHGKVKVGDIAGTIANDGYCHIRVDSKRYQAHRLAWLYVHGEWPTNQIDHINGIRNDNRIANLREATRSENQQNRKTSNYNSTSGYLGVSVNKDAYTSYIRLNGKIIYLGRFKNP